MKETFEQHIQQALSEFTQHREALARVRGEMASLSATVRSKDRAVEVTVGAQGEVTGLRFLNNRHQAMSGQKLAASVLDALMQARQDVLSRATTLFGSVSGIGSGIVGADPEEFDLDRLLDAAGATARPDPDKVAPAAHRSGGSHG
ncbi:YbaB/EbfC family nucleoid-associated protein [Streptomyces mirabilis]|uniref:YbaB/EbfC family nucleoid-associated protein n=1 Tax=Streptomyces mirabilis TaxID=68239 RepID=A0ABU3V5E2_9ACTN|nr:YbaB/EbfC family nucleoid-associated protein [Streptomyces mirabilis]MCX5355745.1 YbaB/EbfC family nucleoid-associated protein [Streptomyces mirabilis]MDU9001388.1 YbaB/EbfC family nucleoid-associated protein [Streptomyces mirabilis]